VLVGYSIGGLYARLFASRSAKEVAGMVIVDHAFEPDRTAAPAPRSTLANSPPVLLEQTPIVLGIEDDRNFAKLPQFNRELHAWAMSRDPLRPTAEAAAECAAAVASATAGNPHPLGATPLAVVSTANDAPGYRELQAKLLSLSTASTQFVADRSSHMVIIDQPEVIVQAIRRVVEAVR
jgi:pimeloyl-ACP methyl ester carboxylesterase